MNEQATPYPEARFHQLLMLLGVALVVVLYSISDRFILGGASAQRAQASVAAVGSPHLQAAQAPTL